MRGTQGFWVAALLLPLVAGAAGAADVKTTMIRLKSGDDQTQGYLAVPEGNGPFPGVVVIQEWWGLNDWIKENARRLAAHGYVALAPDLYHGKVTDDMGVASQLVKGLPRDRALRDLEAAVDALGAREDVQKERLGVIGWCMGGGFSLRLALHDKRILACVMCYGTPVTDPDQLKPLRATVLGIFGEEDKGIPPEMVHKFAEALKEAGKHVAGIRIYKAGHGFMRPNNGPGNENLAYREEPAREAWKRIDAFFAKTLGGK